MWGANPTALALWAEYNGKMVMFDWKEIRKIDAHVHILPDEVHRANPDACDEFGLFGCLDSHEKIMREYGIDAAVIMPFNDPALMSMDFSADAVHKNLFEMKNAYPGKYYAFADVDANVRAEESCEAVVKAVKTYRLDGLKLHPANTGMDAASDYNIQLLQTAEALGIPVAVHSYPNSPGDPCAAAKVAALAGKFPKLKMIVAHMGAFQWEALLDADVYVDFSAVLPDYVRKLGVRATNGILRRFGPDRLIFGTDYPTSRVLRPESVYETYFDILNQMDFTESEAEKIAYGNIASLLKP